MEMFIRTYNEKTNVTPMDKYFEKKLRDATAILREINIILR